MYLSSFPFSSFSCYIFLDFESSSLATAGYGTALGVIRALHSEGLLEKAYCTETRPFNQVSVSLLHSYSSIIEFVQFQEFLLQGTFSIGIFF